MGFYKKRNKDSGKIIVYENETNDKDKHFSEIGTSLSISQSVQNSVQQAATTFAKPETYTGNRNLYDSGTAKQNAKTNLFKDGNIVTD